MIRPKIEYISLLPLNLITVHHNILHKYGYNYSVNIAITRTKEDNTPENININYNGKSDNENIIINKVINNNTLTFYKAGDEK